MKKLTKKDLQKILKTIDQSWKINSAGNAITRIFDIKNYIEALIFLSKVVVHAEVKGIFPTITINSTKVKIMLSVPAKSKLTNIEFNFAKEIDSLILSTATFRL